VPRSEVYCTVRNCHYWADGEHCTAEQILITTDHIGRIYPELVDAGSAGDIARQHGPTEADGCTETCCKTFRARGSAGSGTGPDKMEGSARQLAQRA
jgi:hypothetical protein